MRIAKGRKPCPDKGKKRKRAKKSRVGKLGIVRLHGEDLEKLRRECFERDGYMCQALREFVMPWGQNFKLRCLRDLTWDTGHMAHIRTKRNNGDTLSNVRTLCAECHQKEHNAGGKPVPKKPTEKEFDSLLGIGE